MKRLLIVASVALVLTLAFGLTAWAEEGDEILGLWSVAEGKATVEIYRCGDSYCGKMVALREPLNEDGTPKLDINNPDEARQSTPLLGLVMLWNLKYVGEGQYEDGNIYAADSGKTYSSKAELVNPNQLDVRGFVGISLLGRTDTWTRVQ